MDLKAEMLAIRRERYNINRNLAGTVEGYMDILRRAKQDSSVPYEHVSMCLGSIAMVLHEANRLPEAIVVYRTLAGRRMHEEMKARILQNMGAALVANHQYADAVKITEEALRYAKRVCIPDLMDHLEFNLREARKNAADPPEKIIVAAIKHPIQDLEKKLKDL